MTYMQETSSILNLFAQSWGLDSLGSVGVAIILYLIAAGMICFFAAFCKVREPKLVSCMLALGGGFLLTLLVSGGIRSMLPDLASSFTPTGLWLFSSLFGLFVVAVPVIQALWNTSYLQGLACVAGGLFLFLLLVVETRVFMAPDQDLPARIKSLQVPLFESNNPAK